MTDLLQLINALSPLGVGGCVVWVVRVLWRLDRRVVRLETIVGIEPREGAA